MPHILGMEWEYYTAIGCTLIALVLAAGHRLAAPGRPPGRHSEDYEPVNGVRDWPAGSMLPDADPRAAWVNGADLTETFPPGGGYNPFAIRPQLPVERAQPPTAGTAGPPARDRNPAPFAWAEQTAQDLAPSRLAAAEDLAALDQLYPPAAASCPACGQAGQLADSLAHCDHPWHGPSGQGAADLAQWRDQFENENPCNCGSIPHAAGCSIHAYPDDTYSWDRVRNLHETAETLVERLFDFLPEVLPVKTFTQWASDLCTEVQGWHNETMFTELPWDGEMIP